MKKLLLTFCIIINSHYFLNANIVDRLANPFTGYEDTYDYDTNTKNYNDITTKKNNSWPVLIIIFIAVLFSPRRSRYRTYNYYDDYNIDYNRNSYNSIASYIGDFMLGVLKKKTDKKFFSFSEDEILKKDEEIKRLLKDINIDYNELITYSKNAFEQFIAFMEGKKNKLNEIATSFFYNKYLKEITQLYENSIKNVFEDFKIDDIKIINIRYTENEKAFTSIIKYSSKHYYATITDNKFISGDRFVIKRYIFLTFIYDNGFKLSIIENKDESYVMKMENILIAPEKNKESKDIPIKISKQKLQLKIAEIFYNLYIWWSGKSEKIDENIEPNLKQKLVSIRNKITTDNSVKFKIEKITISNIDFLNSQTDILYNTSRIIIRIKFILKGSYIKNNIVIIDNTENLVDEMWEFEIKENEIYLKDIIKRFINSSDEIEPSPLQIEWYI